LKTLQLPLKSICFKGLNYNEKSNCLHREKNEEKIL